MIDADYHPFAHTCMEPLNATADVKDRAEIWVGKLLGFRRDVVTPDMDPEQVIYTTT